MRLGIVGCGAVAQHGHLPAARNVPGLDLVAVVDTDPDWVRQIARRTGARLATTNYRDLVGNVDAAVVATPNWTHLEIAVYLLEHGVHVLCEKPVALSAADTLYLYEVAERASTRLMAAHSRRFTDSALALHQLLRIGALGGVEEMSAALGVPVRRWPARHAFRADPRLAGGGCLMDSGVHLIDLALWLLGEPAVIEDYRASGRVAGIEDDAWLVLRFAGGARARLACSYSHDLGGRLAVRASDGWASMHVNGTPALEFLGRETTAGRSAGVLQIVSTGTSPYEQQLRHFLDCIRTGEPFMIKPTEVIDGLRILEECYARKAA